MRDWLHELKLDGYRIQGPARTVTRSNCLRAPGWTWTHRMKTIAGLVKTLPVEKVLLDGEVVVLAENGTTSFRGPTAAFQEGEKKPLTYFVFDLLHLNGHSMRGMPLVERKEVLARVVEDPGEFLRLSEHIEGRGETVFQKGV